MEAFYAAYDLITDSSWDFIVKLDGDLSFPPDYFQRCLEIFHQEPRLGIGGGLVCVERKGKLEEEFPDPAFHVRGPTKIYRKKCWENIGGLISVPGWDTFDIVRANMMGWRTRTFREVTLQHHRPTGGAYGSWANWVKNGYANYIVGYHPIFMVLKCARRFLRYPFGLAGIALMAGYVRGYVKRLPRVEDRDAIRYLRMQQVNHLLRRPSLWSMNLPER
ncbi:MAG: glycosyltransferase family 2 protein [Verrucomicrobiaceae bacterium]|nr:MAG: glycosyltransferase family 2 protein [Verrucomicrobiaceae bacterium]